MFLQIVSHLLQVFVSIEMTGQSVQFEQKFNYRRPMYVVMQYLWKLPEHRNNFVYVKLIMICDIYIWYTGKLNIINYKNIYFLLYNYSTLAQDAEANMEAVHPPLFLCFINLLMNDAVFLLDEALSNMAQLRQMIQAR